MKEKKNDNSHNEESKAIQKHVQCILRIYYDFLCSSSVEEKAEIYSKRQDKQAIWYEEKWDLRIEEQMEMIHRVLFLHICLKKKMFLFFDCPKMCRQPDVLQGAMQSLTPKGSSV